MRPAITANEPNPLPPNMPRMPPMSDVKISSIDVKPSIILFKNVI
jgi:hypothetical protein